MPSQINQLFIPKLIRTRTMSYVTGPQIILIFHTFARLLIIINANFTINTILIQTIQIKTIHKRWSFMDATNTHSNACSTAAVNGQDVIKCDDTKPLIRKIPMFLIAIAHIMPTVNTVWMVPILIILTAFVIYWANVYYGLKLPLYTINSK